MSFSVRTIAPRPEMHSETNLEEMRTVLLLISRKFGDKKSRAFDTQCRRRTALWVKRRSRKGTYILFGKSKMGDARGDMPRESSRNVFLV